MSMMWLVRYGASIERDTFASDTADYLTFVLFGALVLLGLGHVLGMLILAKPLVLMVIYYWSRKNPDIEMSFLFGLRFKAIYFPWVLVGFNVLMGGMPVQEIVGIVVGHLYFFLVDVLPAQMGGRQVLSTPAFLRYYFPGDAVPLPPHIAQFARSPRSPATSRSSPASGGLQLGARTCAQPVDALTR